MLDIFGGKTYFLIFILFCYCLVLPNKIYGQDNQNLPSIGEYKKYKPKPIKRKGMNLPNYDNRFIHYGFFLAMNRSTFNIYPSREYNANIVRGYYISPRTDIKDTIRNPLSRIEPKGSFGFTTGFIFNLRLFEFLDFRVLPTVSFYQRFARFYSKDGTESVQLNQSTYSFVELPILFKYKSVRRNNTRMYMVAGIKPSWEIGAKRNELQDDVLRLNSNDFSIDYGFGFDLYYPLFKFSPELRFSHGVSNLRFPDSNIYARSINRLNSHTITLFFHFE